MSDQYRSWVNSDSRKVRWTVNITTILLILHLQGKPKFLRKYDIINTLADSLRKLFIGGQVIGLGEQQL